MNTILEKVTQRKKIIVAVFIVLAIAGGMLMFAVNVNYSMMDYLPEDAQSTTALKVMEDEFASGVPNLRVMIENVSLTEAVEYKERIAMIDGVSGVMWLDDVTDITQPIETIDTATVESYYKDECALMSVTIEEGYELDATNAIYELLGDKGALSGEAVDTASSQRMSVTESVKAIFILVPVILVILLLFTNSWIEPLLFLVTIGIAVLINMGSNIIFGEISFITQAISPILQMAVSLDYAIFLLNSFAEYRKQDYDAVQAMKMAMRRSFTAIIASAATTLFGFVALIFMNFRIGSDLGINLVKGIIISFISVMVFLPALTLCCYKLIDKTKHRRLMPTFKNVGKGLLKLRVPALILVILIAVPCFLAQSKTEFIYGTGDASENSTVGIDEQRINEKFGQSNAIVLLVERGDPAREAELCSELQQIDHVTGIMSYATTVGTEIPDEYLDESITSQFYSENYSRIIVYTDTEEEGETAFSVVEEVQQKAEEYYSQVLSCGQSVNLLDIKNVVSEDSTIVNIIAVVSIALVLLFTFKSISLPLILLFTIEAAIWINMSVAYFAGNSLSYIGYLVINTVQLGATVDYAILLTETYTKNRKVMKKKEALKVSIGETFSSILTSAIILAGAGFCLGIVSTNTIISELGILLGRGTVLSMIMVICLLPALLTIFDKVIEKTSLRMPFYKE